MRRTDVFVCEQLRLTPLSVSADRIAHVALRCAVLLAKFEAAGGPVNRSGSGPIAEVYPAASLRSWGLDHRGYKQKTVTGALARLVDHLPYEAPWLDCATCQAGYAPFTRHLRRSYRCDDSPRCGPGQTIPPVVDDLAAATAEGWIAIPDKPINALL